MPLPVVQNLQAGVKLLKAVLVLVIALLQTWQDCSRFECFSLALGWIAHDDSTHGWSATFFFLIMMILAPLVQDSWNAPSGVG